jgi:hypothetical protein
VDDRHWPKAEIRDGKLLVEGERYPFVRGMQRHIYIRVGELTHERHIEIDEGRTRRTDRLSAIATIENDKLAIAGVTGTEDAHQELSFSIKPVPDEEKKFHWNVSFGVRGHESKIGLEDGWSCEVYLPARMFNELVAAYKGGMVDRLRLGCACDMWTRDGMQRLPNLPASAKVTWFLSPPLDDSDAPGLGRGVVKEFSWLEAVEPKSKQNEEPGHAAPDTRRAMLKMGLGALIAMLAALVAMAAFILIK